MQSTYTANHDYQLIESNTICSIYIYIFIYLITLNTRNDEIWWFPEMAPQKWMVYFMETPKITWMRTRGIPI